MVVSLSGRRGIALTFCLAPGYAEATGVTRQHGTYWHLQHTNYREKPLCRKGSRIADAREEASWTGVLPDSHAGGPWFESTCDHQISRQKYSTFRRGAHKVC